MASARRVISGLYLVSRLQDELDWAIARAAELTDDERTAADLVPPIDVLETEQAVVIVVEAPGLATADLEVETVGSRVTIRGQRAAGTPASGPVRYHCLECSRGDFQRSVELIGALDTRGARARLARGLLRIEIPKIVDRRRAPRRIEIESGEE